MAVYTEIGDDELRAFTALYDIGEVLSCKGIAEGVENSNFLLTTERANFILTLYEKRVAPADLPFFIALMDHLAHHGVACPTPVRARDGEALRELCGRPAAIVTFLNGMWPRRIDPFHCAALGSALARLHLAGDSHADLFPDKVFFRDRVLSGLIDFCFACTDFLAWDIAICLNAWCFEAD